MKKLQKTIYITAPNAYLSLDGETVVVSQEKEKVGQVPLSNVENIVCFGYRGVSPALMGACAEKGIGLCFLTPHGRFLARVSGPVSGNVLLRTKQIHMAADPTASLHIAKQILIGKLFNGRWSLERVRRDHPMRVDDAIVSGSIEQIKAALQSIPEAMSRDELMGIEGTAAKSYFHSFPQMILKNKEDFSFDGRNRRPPMDPVNAMLSFTYTLLGNDIVGALESVGLDPAVGFLHTLRPGRYSLALDLLEELRAPLADRFVLSQINLGKVNINDFSQKENGAFYLKDDARKKFLSSWKSRKEEVIQHPYLKEKIAWGLVCHAQAMLLARYLRGDLDDYPPFLWK